MSNAETTKKLSFTGHRPPRLTLGGLLPAYSVEQMNAIIAVITQYFLSLPALPSEFRAGGALGGDAAATIAAFRLKIPVHLVLPFEGMDSNWHEDSKKLHARLMERAESVTYVNGPGYRPWKMEARNDVLMELADEVVALFDGQRKGGTAQAVGYAKTLNKPVHNLWPDWLEYGNVLQSQPRNAEAVA